jgi:DNA-binding SARP family transcriptional activator/tetratricopeptide (TPR) repeat protein
MALPPSRKTRALLAYLCLNRRRFRREQLCDLLWEVPDDPRGSLRWSLSKLRRLLDDENRQRVLADRTSVEVDVQDLGIDVVALHALAGSSLKDASIETLEQAARRYRGNFLEELEFFNFHDFHAWCVAEREHVSRAQAALLRQLVERLQENPARALPYARALVGLLPYDESSRAMLIRLLHESQHLDEASQQYQIGLRMLKEAGVVSTGALLRARVGGKSGSTGAPAELPEQHPRYDAGVRAVTDSLIGRDEEVRLLADAMSSVASDSLAQIIVVRGEPGIGKSRMLQCVSRLATDRNAFLLEAGAFQPESIRPFALWIDALRTLDPVVAERLFGGSEAQNRDRLLSGLSAFITAESMTRPVVVLFDDVQWCDESSAAALHYVARMNRRRPLLAVLAVRDGELQDNAVLQQTLGGLRHDGLLREIKLFPLSAAATAQLVRKCCPGVDAERLHQACRGNPLLAIELARAERDGAGASSLDQLVQERLARFDVNGAEVLKWAAVLSPRIDVPMLVTLTSFDAMEVTAVLESAEQRAILSTTAHGLRFSHELIARAIYHGISPVRRQVMHRRVAGLLEQNTAMDLARASDLAHHATQSGDPALAAKAMVSAGRLCLRFFANAEALSLARKGLQLCAQLPAADRVCLKIDFHDIMLAAAPLSDWEEAARRYVELAEEALDHGKLAHARLGYHMASSVRWQHGQWAGAREQSLQSERVARGGSDRDQVTAMADTAKCLLMLERDLTQADALLMEAEALAARQHIRHHSIPAGRAMLRYYENRLDEAEELFKQARTLCKYAGDRVSEYQANEYLVMINFQQERYAEARSRCAELVALGRKLREGSEAPFANALQGLCTYAIDDSPAELDRALDDLRIADAKHRLAYVQTRSALLDYERGRTAEALERAGEALACAELLERTTEMMLAHLVLGLCYRASGREAEAARHIASVESLEAAGVAEWARQMARSLSGTREKLQA